MKKLAQEDIINVLKQCYDPEIPVDLWNLGLIYDIAFDDQASEPTNVDITMSLTTPGCGMADQMANDIKQKVESLDGVENTIVTVTFDPAWKPEMMTDDAKEKLGFYPTPASSEKIENSEWE
tara:strand:+ start:114 stop:479 length:366 start_codon:yes stop_codon:yes gene_type:complete